MKLYKVVLSGLALCASMTAFAQKPAEEGAKTVYDFVPHFYIQGQIGGQYTLGEISFGKLLSPNAQLGIGYQFNPVFGLRLSANAWQSKGGWDVNNTTYKWKYNYVAPQLDLTFNLSNLLCGFNPNRIFNLSFLLGGGANIAWNNDEAADANAAIMKATAVSDVDYNGQNLQYLWDGTKVRGFGHAALAADFRVSDRVALGLEVGANVLSDHYNSKKAGNPDWYFNALAGIKVNLCKSYNKREIPAPAPQVVERVVEKYVDKPAAEEKHDEIQRYVYYKIAKTDVDAVQERKLEDIAGFLNEHKDAKVTVTGYADAGTGNAKINARLAQQRAEKVAKMLESYGIDSSRITVNSKGDTVQPFSENDRNRVVIAIAK
jgi:OOP family OmpA-OmpF porin